MNNKLNAQRIAIAISAGVGIFACFMPWVKLPLIGSISGSSGDGIIFAFILVVPLLLALLGDKTKEMDKKAKLASALIGVLVLLLASFNISEFNSRIDKARIESGKSIDSSSMSSYLDSSSKEIAKNISNSIMSSVGIEFGLYLLIISNISLISCSSLQKLFYNSNTAKKQSK